jgi:holo-[acyl-carrier protein] synthase
MNCLGVDIIEISRIKEAIDLWGEHFLARIYTERELQLYRNDLPSLAARFAAKEAVIKALAPQDNWLNLREIEILAEPGGPPQVHLYGRSLLQAENHGVRRFLVSLSHCREYAVACAVNQI